MLLHSADVRAFSKLTPLQVPGAKTPALRKPAQVSNPTRLLPISLFWARPGKTSPLRAKRPHKHDDPTNQMDFWNPLAFCLRTRMQHQYVTFVPVSIAIYGWDLKLCLVLCMFQWSVGPLPRVGVDGSSPLSGASSSSSGPRVTRRRAWAWRRGYRRYCG